MVKKIELDGMCSECGLCATIEPTIFQIPNGRVEFQDGIDPLNIENVGNAELAAEACPKGVIVITDK
jgi:ferredoxin